MRHNLQSLFFLTLSLCFLWWGIAADRTATNLLKQKDVEIKQLKREVDYWKQQTNVQFARTLSAHADLDKYKQELNNYRR
jgi:hypothetical protein